MKIITGFWTSRFKSVSSEIERFDAAVKRGCRWRGRDNSRDLSTTLTLFPPFRLIFQPTFRSSRSISLDNQCQQCASCVVVYFYVFFFLFFFLFWNWILFQMCRSIRDSAACRYKRRDMYATKSRFSFLFSPQKISMRSFNLAMNDSKTFSSSRELNSHVGIKTAKRSTNECTKLTNNRRRIGVFKPIPCLTTYSYIFLAGYKNEKL